MSGSSTGGGWLARRRVAIVTVAVLCSYACLLLHTANHDAQPADVPCVLCVLGDQPISLGSPVAMQILPAAVDTPQASAGVLSGAETYSPQSARGPPALV